MTGERPAPTAVEAEPAVPSRAVQCWLFLVLLLGGGLLHHRVAFGNTVSRDLLVAAVVERHSFAIDPWRHETNDISTNAVTGHIYSNKAIGAPLLGVPVYALTRWLWPTPVPAANTAPAAALTEDSTGVSAEPLPSAAPLIAVQLATATLPFAILGVLLYRLTLSWGASQSAAVFAALGWGFGTIAWIHATMNSGHLAAAAGCFAGYCLIARPAASPLVPLASPSGGGETRGVGRFALAGLLVGAGALCDYTAMYMACCLTVYLAWQRPGGLRFAAWCVGGALCVAVLLAYNAACFGSVFSMPMSGANMVSGEFAGGASRGVLGVSLPNPVHLYYLLVSPARGLFAISPILLLAVFGLGRLRTVRAERRADVLLIGAIVVGYLLINAGFYGWHGGWTFGPRYLVPMLPFLAVGLAFAPRHRLLTAILVFLSVAQVGLAVFGNPHANDDIRNPLPHLVLPLMGDGYTAVTPFFGTQSPWIGLIYVACLILYLVSVLRRQASALDAVSGSAALPGIAPSRQVRMVLAAWSVAVVILLLFTRESPPDLPYFKRAQALRHLGRVTGDERFEAASERQRQLARDAIQYLPDSAD